MVDHRKMYLLLFNALERSLDILKSNCEAEEKILLSAALLGAGQQSCEDLYVGSTEE